MNFYIPTKLYTETNCIINHSKELASFGKKAFLITGATSSKKNGSLDAVINALDLESIPYSIYDKIEENPSVETVMAATKQGIEEQVDYVIGIGGGSPLDAAKAIALMIQNPEKTSAILYHKITLKALPVIAVPTTAGTGSEATPYAILTLHDEKTKRSISHRIFPALSLVDSSYLKTMPKPVLINTAIDALSHLIESYININATTYSKMFCEYGFQLWGSVKHILTDESANDNELEKLMIASTVAGMAISHTGTSLPHGMSYGLTYDKDLPHGKAVGIFLSAYINALPSKEVRNHILTLLGFEHHSAFSHFLHNLLGDVVIETQELESYVTAMMNNKDKLANCPYPVTNTILKNIYLESIIIKN